MRREVSRTRAVTGRPESAVSRYDSVRLVSRPLLAVEKLLLGRRWLNFGKPTSAGICAGNTSTEPRTATHDCRCSETGQHTFRRVMPSMSVEWQWSISLALFTWTMLVQAVVLCCLVLRQLTGPRKQNSNPMVPLTAPLVTPSSQQFWSSL